ncbi:MAG: hypothetical protein AUH36_01740 [Chloroflexi bacterium 13_1_40CM_55_7]|nr:MAG: hypothetical protein AUH36_01740 [Chloroflexi bacterium 13_1_40CM_55_7]
MRRTSIAIAVLIAASVASVSCGNYNNSTSSSSQQSTSGLKFRAFVSNPLRPTANGGTTPVIEIVDALQDKLPGFAVSLSGANPDPGLMAVSPNKKFTLVFSASNNAVTVIDNARESMVQSGSGALPSIALAGFTQSMVVGPDNLTGYAAVPATPVVGQSPGAVEVLSLSTASIAATLPVSGARTVAGSHNGNRILVFGDAPDRVTVIAPSLLGTNTNPLTTVQDSVAFDHPVWGIFSSDDTTAYILNCGPECGGSAASVTVFDLNTNTPGVSIPVNAATIGLLSGSTLYVAGTPPGIPCGPGTAATVCGTVNVVDLNSMTVTGSSVITDGFHHRMELGSNGQIFIGAKNCTNINTSASGSNAGEVRGCLSIFNTNNSTVVIPPEAGDVTGLQPITNRNVVYVIQQGELRIYDTTTDKLQGQQVDILGQADDVKLVD